MSKSIVNLRRNIPQTIKPYYFFDNTYKTSFFNY